MRIRLLAAAAVLAVSGAVVAPVLTAAPANAGTVYVTDSAFVNFDTTGLTPAQAAALLDAAVAKAQAAGLQARVFDANSILVDGPYRTISTMFRYDTRVTSIEMNNRIVLDPIERPTNPVVLP